MAENQTDPVPKLIRFPPGLVRELVEAAYVARTSQSEYVRTAVAEKIERDKKQMAAA